MSTIFSKAAQARIKKIHRLSAKYNRKIGKPHPERLLELMRKHVDEIAELCYAKDPHALIETGDLMVLCLELLLEHGRSADEIMEVCFDRYDKKLGQLLKDISSGPETAGE